MFTDEPCHKCARCGVSRPVLQLASVDTHEDRGRELRCRRREHCDALLTTTTKPQIEVTT